ncbi:hypothetical protein M3Y99_00044900 [Aphelenchoides fujianensis]|nr:hypothetical protein M3Y99_00044900 [Aphelenchoides fujianensis]
MEIEQRMTRNKKCVELDFNSVGGMIAIKEICAASDVLIDPFRPGVLERFGNGAHRIDESLIIARISGYGQFGPLAGRPGNDINFVAMSGVLPRISGKETRSLAAGQSARRRGERRPPFRFRDLRGPPATKPDGRGLRCLDCSTVDGLIYLSTFLHAFKDVDLLWTHDFGVFSSRCPIYRTYETKDGKHVAVGAVERRFNLELFKTLGITKKLSEMIANPEHLVAEMEGIFKQKTQDRVGRAIQRSLCCLDLINYSACLDSNACVTPVLDLDEVHQLEHHKQRETFQRAGDDLLPRPQPRMFKAEELAALQRAERDGQGFAWGCPLSQHDARPPGWANSRRFATIPGSSVFRLLLEEMDEFEKSAQPTESPEEVQLIRPQFPIHSE